MLVPIGLKPHVLTSSKSTYNSVLYTASCLFFTNGIAIVKAKISLGKNDVANIGSNTFTIPKSIFSEIHKNTLVKSRVSSNGYLRFEILYNKNKKAGMEVYLDDTLIGEYDWIKAPIEERIISVFVNLNDSKEIKVDSILIGATRFSELFESMGETEGKELKFVRAEIKNKDGGSVMSNLLKFIQHSPTEVIGILAPRVGA